MKMELMQPFITPGAVIAETMDAPRKLPMFTMEEGNYITDRHRRSGRNCGEIEGRVITRMEMAAAQQATADIAGAEAAFRKKWARETFATDQHGDWKCRNTADNYGFKSRVHPPEIYAVDAGLQGLPTRKRSCCGLRRRKALST